MGKVICLLLIICAIVAVESQLCDVPKVTTYIAWDTRKNIVRETYRTYSGRCYNTDGCIKTRWRMSLEKYSSIKTKLKIVKYCCDGYIELENGTSDGDVQTCQPACWPACKNANCIAPDECKCYPGYDPDPDNENHCLYKCPEGFCDYGTCSAPNVCHCHTGYTLVNQTCQPVCTNLCVNATCVAPETCECHFGYRQVESNICKPYCSGGCENGTCIAPEMCRCLSGYSMLQNSSLINQSCGPVCSVPCHNGTCVAPDSCVCDSGYKANSNGECEPICSPPCENGICVAPQTCRCHSGYIKYNDSCVPHCTNGCGNGSCSGPDSCICDSGFHKNTTTDECEPVCSHSCGNGTCVAPETCECYPGYEWNSTCISSCPGGCDGEHCVSSYECQCETDWEYKNGTCVPKCKHACGNGTCVMPNVCYCFQGYHLDVMMLLKGLISGPLCIPTCIGCAGICVAPNKCVETLTKQNNILPDEYDDEDYHETTVTDDMTSELDDTKETSNKSVFHQHATNESHTQKISWIKQSWPFVVFPVLFFVIVALAILFAIRWKSLRHYMKRGSYTVAGDNLDVSGASPVSFSNIYNNCTVEKI